MSAIVTQQELDRRRKLRDARVEKAERLGVAIGWISEDLELLKPDAPKLPKPPRDAA